jgi:hypothetical protein
MEQQMRKRRWFAHHKGSDDYFAGEANECREKAAALPAGKQRDALLTKARRADTMSNIKQWLDAQGLKQTALHCSVEEEPECICGARFKLIYKMRDARSKSIHRLFECDCGRCSWDEQPDTVPRG